MGNLSNYNQYYRTSNANAVAADIASGKIAYGADGKLVGTYVPPELPEIIGTYTHFDGATDTTETLNVPTHQNGDLLLAVLMARSSSASHVNTPSGWTKFGHIHEPTTYLDQSFHVYTRIAASEPASYTWTYGASGRNCGGMMAIRGATTVSLVSSAAVNQQSSEYSVTPSTYGSFYVSMATWVYTQATVICDVTGQMIYKMYETNAGNIRMSMGASIGADTHSHPENGGGNVSFEPTGMGALLEIT